MKFSSGGMAFLFLISEEMNFKSICIAAAAAIIIRVKVT